MLAWCPSVRGGKRPPFAAVLFVLALIGHAGCGDGDEETPKDGGTPDASRNVDGGGRRDVGPGETWSGCPSYGEGRSVGLVLHLGVKEASGVAASRRNEGVLWVHNDSGDGPRIHAISTKGEVAGSFELSGIEASDWEDIAIGPGPDPSLDYLYVGDIGGNGGRRRVEVHRFPEPEVVVGDPSLVMVSSVESFLFEYPDGDHNAETLLLDPRTGDLYIVGKAGSGASPVFRAEAPLSREASATLEAITTLDFATPPLSGQTTTGGDISITGDAIAIRTYDSAFLWRRDPGQTVAEALEGEPCPLPLRQENQGEALGFDVNGRDYYSLGEGTLVNLNFYERR